MMRNRRGRRTLIDSSDTASASATSSPSSFKETIRELKNLLWSLSEYSLTDG